MRNKHQQTIQAEKAQAVGARTSMTKHHVQRKPLSREMTASVSQQIEPAPNRHIKFVNASVENTKLSPPIGTPHDSSIAYIIHEGTSMHRVPNPHIVTARCWASYSLTIANNMLKHTFSQDLLTTSLPQKTRV
eukprot:gnl/MRDRNA2_/MRDRNA2_83732_c0_seq1.p1 gnl/MRDRNA2_/MRDRNA2_83732_c0~~gnl/MRDRNA2_/MRDRNA2_83732_c0_seq1.p1  ORF type:complete len:133 (-),score=10.22 gnl/MRDRNA2_/MRDRNA2_83732_c0_seq1:189-587(-)